MESNRFEDSFRNAFAGAEVLPSAAVWKNIELDLAKESGGKLKRNLLMFQLLAAASVAFAFGFAGLYYLSQPTANDSNTQSLTEHNIPKHSPMTEPTQAQKLKSDERLPNRIAQEKPAQGMDHVSHESDKPVVDQSSIIQSENSGIEYTINRKGLSDFVETKKAVLVLPKEERVEPDAGMVLLARLKDEEKKYQDEEKKAAGSREKIWASVGFGAGSYKPNVQSSSANLGVNALSGDASTSSQSPSGSSYSVGVNVASKISRRFILQGGVSYLTQNADFTSIVSSQGSATLSEFAQPANFDRYQGVSPYSVNSSMQFVSVPVQVGYLIVDQAFGIQLNGGIATDLFVSNTLSPENDSYQKVTQAAGQDSPYRTVNFSGLLGTEFSYRIADHYRISLNPGLRYALHSIYKEEVAAEITPVTFDVSLRFRYIFK